jgi:hypothetical protein
LPTNIASALASGMQCEEAKRDAYMRTRALR